MDYLIELQFEGPGFVAVPNRVIDDERLSADAIGVLTYLARLAGQRTAIVRVSAVRKRFRFGKDKWQRIAKELRAVGSISDLFENGPFGQVRRSLIIGWPSAAPSAAVENTRGAENPAHGVPPVDKSTGRGPDNPAHGAENPAHLSRKTRPLKEHQNSKAARRASKASAARGLAGGKGHENDDEERSAIARSLGLAYRNPVTGEWVRATADTFDVGLDCGDNLSPRSGGSADQDKS